MLIGILIIIAALLALAYYFTVWSKTQVFGYFPYVVKTERKLMALTFDDGPNPPDTEKLLEVLEKHGVKATFFVCGQNAEKWPDLVRRAAEAGHVIGNHSFNHNFTNNFLSLRFESEISRTQAAIEKIINQRPALYRSPWLFRQPWLLKNLKRHGLTPVAGYFASSWEAWHPAPLAVAAEARKVIAPGRIIIMHDGGNLDLFSWNTDRSATVAAVDLLIPELKKQGYEFTTIDQLLGVAPYQTI